MVIWWGFNVVSMEYDIIGSYLTSYIYNMYIDTGYIAMLQQSQLLCFLTWVFATSIQVPSCQWRLWNYPGPTVYSEDYEIAYEKPM